MAASAHCTCHYHSSMAAGLYTAWYSQTVPKKVVDPTYAKTQEYRQVLETIADEGNCPFCPDNFRHHKNPILKQCGDWFITRNSWPYENAAEHFLIISTVHKEEITDLTPDDLTAVHQIIRWAKKEFALAGGGLTLRFGETSHTGATVCHLHFHLIVPKINPVTGRAQVVNFPIG